MCSNSNFWAYFSSYSLNSAPWPGDQTCTKKGSEKDTDFKKGTKRLSKVERSKVTILSPLDEIIVGLLLGDGHIQKRSINCNSRLMYAQSSLRIQHLNYFNLILDLFRPFISEDFQLKNRTFTDKRTNKIYSSVSFATLSLPCFNYYRNLFYNSPCGGSRGSAPRALRRDNLKIIPSNISQILTPRGLAFLIMDEGSLQNKGLHLNTYGSNTLLPFFLLIYY